MQTLLSDVPDEDLGTNWTELTNLVSTHSHSDYCLQLKGTCKLKQCRMNFGDETEVKRDLVDDSYFFKPKYKTDVRLFLPRNHPGVTQRSKSQIEGWRANADLQCMVDFQTSPRPNDAYATTALSIGLDDTGRAPCSRLPVRLLPTDTDALKTYVTGYACKDEKTSSFFHNILKQMAVEGNQQSSERPSFANLARRLVMNTVGEKERGSSETVLELNGGQFWHCSRKFKRTSLSGSAQSIQGDGTSIGTSLISQFKKLDSEVRAKLSFYEYLAQNGQVPVVAGDVSFASWPLTERYCEVKLQLHKRGSWSKVADLKDGCDTYVEAFTRFMQTPECPTFLTAEVEQAKKGNPAFHASRNHQQTSTDDRTANFLGEDSQQEHDAVQCSLIMESYPEITEKLPDGGADYDWSVPKEGNLRLPAGGEHWLLSAIADSPAAEISQATEEVPKMWLANERQRAFISLVVRHAMKVEQCKRNNQQPPPPLRCVCFGNAGTGKSFCIKTIKHLLKLVCKDDRAVCVVGPTGMCSFLADGVTAHSLFGIPISKKELDTNFINFRGTHKTQDNLAGVRTVLCDEKSMVGRRLLGWMEKSARVNANEGRNAAESWGGLDSVVLLGDDNQLPPVCDATLGDRTINKRKDSAASSHGAVAYSEFNTAIELDQIMRQDPTEREFCDVIASQLSDQQFAPQTRDWEWCNSRRISQLPPQEQAAFEEGMALFPTHELKNDYNIKKLMKCGAVAKVKSLNQGKHCQADDAGGLPKLSYLGRGVRVMMTSNVHSPWGLFNGAIGEVVDVLFSSPDGPSKGELPVCVNVRFPHYKGPAWCADDPTVVPVPVIERRCEKKCCSRKMVPLVPAWALTIHKCQGMTIGEKEPIKKASIFLGPSKGEKNNPGLMLVACSRGQKGSDIAFLDESIDMERLQAAGKSEGAAKRHAEVVTLRGICERTLAADNTLTDYGSFISMINDIYKDSNLPELDKSKYEGEAARQRQLRSEYQKYKEDRIRLRRLSSKKTEDEQQAEKRRRQKDEQEQQEKKREEDKRKQKAAELAQERKREEEKKKQKADELAQAGLRDAVSKLVAVLACIGVVSAVPSFSHSSADQHAISQSSKAMSLLLEVVSRMVVPKDSARVPFLAREFCEYVATNSPNIRRRADLGDPFDILVWLQNHWDTIPPSSEIYNRLARFYPVFCRCRFVQYDYYFCRMGHRQGRGEALTALPLVGRAQVSLTQLMQERYSIRYAGTMGKCPSCPDPQEEQALYQYAECSGLPDTLIVNLTTQSGRQPFSCDLRNLTEPTSFSYTTCDAKSNISSPYILVAAIFFKPGHYVAVGRGADGKLRMHDSNPLQRRDFAEPQTLHGVPVGFKLTGMWFVKASTSNRPSESAAVRGLVWDQNNCYVSSLLTCLAYLCMWTGGSVSHADADSSFLHQPRIPDTGFWSIGEETE